jgi:hypothetical protein
MGDLKVSEAFTDAVYITDTAGSAATTKSPTCTQIKIATDARTNLVVAEIGSGWYKATFTPDAAGSWALEWTLTNYIIYNAYKLFKVGAGRIEDVYDRLAAPAGASVSADIADVEGKVDDLEGRLTAARAGYLDELAALNLPADVDTANTSIGDPSGDNLTSLTAKIGDSTSDLVTILAAINTALTFEHQPDVSVSQAAAVQNTWYTALDTTANVRVYNVLIKCAAAAEDLELKITIDGQTLTGQKAGSADGVFCYAIIGELTDGLTMQVTPDPSATRAFLIEGRSVKIEYRKTSNVGASTLYCRIKYGAR